MAETSLICYGLNFNFRSPKCNLILDQTTTKSMAKTSLISSHYYDLIYKACKLPIMIAKILKLLTAFHRDYGLLSFIKLASKPVCRA